jgi:hypothetical protein
MLVAVFDRLWRPRIEPPYPSSCPWPCAVLLLWGTGASCTAMSMPMLLDGRA